MESSSSSRTNREKMVKKVIWPAIRGRSCPICLKDLEAREAAVLTDCKHAYCVRCIRKWSGLKRNCPLCNAHFDSWFCDISLSSRTFYKKRLSALNNNIADNTRNNDVRVGFRRTGHRHRRSTFYNTYDHTWSAYLVYKPTEQDFHDRRERGSATGNCQQKADNTEDDEASNS
nr:e3 ubiquitin-protein ligase topors [Quercus suber]